MKKAYKISNTYERTYDIEWIAKKLLWERRLKINTSVGKLRAVLKIIKVRERCHWVMYYSLLHFYRNKYGQSFMNSIRRPIKVTRLAP